MIRKNPNGTYTARLRGFPQRTFPLKREAEEYQSKCRDTRRRIKSGLEIDAGPITYKALCDLWQQNYDPSDWRMKMLDYSKADWGNTLVRAMKSEALGVWINELKGRKGGQLSSKTKNHIIEAMRVVLSAGVEWGYLGQSPARGRALKTPSQARMRPINPFESWDDVMKVAGEIGLTGPLVRFICATGLRTPSEWLHLKWSDVDFQQKRLVVSGTKTANAARTIPLGARAIEALNDLPRSIDGRIFIGKRGGKLDYHEWRRVDWPAALTAAGMSYRTPYEMRHTFAVLALQANVPIDDVADILGHGNVDITYRYYRKWTKKMAERSRNLLDTIGDDEEKKAHTFGAQKAP